MNVLTMGVFDLFHRGHVRLLSRCRALAGEGSVTVGLNTDEFTERYKGSRPVVSYADRRAVLEACRYVDTVIPNAQPDGSARDVIEDSGAQLIVVAGWRDKDYLGQIGVSQDWLDERDVWVLHIPYTDGISTTEIKRRR